MNLGTVKGRQNKESGLQLNLENAMNSLLSRLLRRPDTQKTAHLTFTVYSRAGCSCCDKAMKLLKEAQRKYGFTIDVVDIDPNPDLVAKYNTEVPVVTVNGKVRFRGVVNPGLLERLLVAESRQSGSSGLSED
jgi:glutaredoxin